MSKRNGDTLAKREAEAAAARASNPIGANTSSSGNERGGGKRKKHDDAQTKDASIPKKNGSKVAPSSGGSKTIAGGGGSAMSTAERQARFLAWRDELNGPGYGEPGFSLWFSPNPYKRSIEKAWLEWTVVWTTVVGYIMLTGLGTQWSDPQLLALGGFCMMGTYYWPYYRSSSIHFPTLNGMFYGNVALAFTTNYIVTPFFFDVLHMRYGFKVELRVDRNPIFLYMVTVAYFATCQVLSTMCVRRTMVLCNYGRYWTSEVNDILRLGLGIIRIYILCLIPFVIALVVQALLNANANPFVADLLCYDDSFWAVTFGTFARGLGFVFNIPVWMYSIRDEPLSLDFGEMMAKKSNFKLFFSSTSRFWHCVCGHVAAVLLHGACLYYLRHYVAPDYTEVIEGSDPFGGCLSDWQQQQQKQMMPRWLQMFVQLVPGVTLASFPSSA